jgi:predicted PurR-regulated permease PerM
MQHKRYRLALLIPALLLLIPLIAMQFRDDVNWTLFDFVIAGVLLIGTSYLCEFVLRKVTSAKYRVALIVLLLLILLLIWAELAVGIFGSPFAGS